MRRASLPALQLRTGGRDRPAPHLEHGMQSLVQRQTLQALDLAPGQPVELAHPGQCLAADELALPEQAFEEVPSRLRRRSFQAPAQALGQACAELVSPLAEALAQMRGPELAGLLLLEPFQLPAQLARSGAVD